MAVITCTHCGASGNAPDHILGQQVRCSKCKQSFIAGGSAPAEAAFADASDAPADDEQDEGFPTNEDISRSVPARAKGKARDEDEAPEEEEVDETPGRSIKKPARRAGNSSLMDLLLFRRMIAPYLIIVMFWLGMALAIFGSLAAIVFGIIGGASGLPMALGGLVFLFVGPISVRLSCEILIVVFRINETLTDIRNHLHKTEPPE